MPKRDNGSLGAKAKVRRAVMFDGASVLECFAGSGAMYRQAWSSAAFGACLDENSDKIHAAAMEREGWACYAGDTPRAIRHGFMAHVPFDIVDVDAYGSPWESVRAWLVSRRSRAALTVLVVTDGTWSRIGFAGIPKILLASDQEDRKQGWTRERYFERVRAKLDSWAQESGLQVLDVAIQAPTKVRGRPMALKMAQYTIRVQAAP